jgi:hypothetical protein
MGDNKVNPIRVVITGADTKYFGSLINLIGSIHRGSNPLPLIWIFDLGLSFFERNFLKNIKNVEIKKVPQLFDHTIDLKNFSWKIIAIHETIERMTEDSAVLWLDAGIELCNSVHTLFDTIERDGYLFNISPLNHPNCRVANLTHESAFNLMGVAKSQYENVPMINAGIQGYLKGHLSNKIVSDALFFASDPNVICGSIADHRHDQSIFSILRERYNLPAKFWLIYEPHSGFREPFLTHAMSSGFIERESQVQLTKVVKPIAFSTRLNNSFFLYRHLRYKFFAIMYRNVCALKAYFYIQKIKIKRIIK